MAGPNVRKTKQFTEADERVLSRLVDQYGDLKARQKEIALNLDSTRRLLEATMRSGRRTKASGKRWAITWGKPRLVRVISDMRKARLLLGRDVFWSIIELSFSRAKEHLDEDQLASLVVEHRGERALTVKKAAA